VNTKTVDGAPRLAWPGAILPLRRGRFSARVELRSVVVTVVVILGALGCAVWSLTLGSAGLGVGDLVDALRGTADANTTRTLLQWRMPRTVFALFGGAALGAGGAVFQSITRNPLGSPDIIGFSTGAYTGALLVMLFGASGSLATSLGALAGGVLTGVVVYLFAYQRGVTGMRIIVVGIGVSLFLGAFNTWLLTTMRVERAIAAASWGSGSLLDIAWTHAVPVIVAVVLAVPALMWGETDMRMMEMGDDIGRGLGVSTDAVRVRMLLVGVALVAVVTASAGPIAFVALAAPQLAMRLGGTPGVRILPSAALGALLLLASDMVARTVLAPTQLPVRVVTLCVGGAYLVWLLASQGKRNR
jgi:iron complex transport system permease protein